MVDTRLYTAIGLILLAGVFAVSPTCGNEPQQTESEEPIREIFVPYEDLNVLLESNTNHVFLSRDQYDDLVKRASVAPSETAPLGASIVSANYTASIQGQRVSIEGDIRIDVLRRGLQAIALDISHVGLLSATLDDEPAPVGKAADGRQMLFVEGTGSHQLKLQLACPLESSTTEQTLTLNVPTNSATSFRLSAPGDVRMNEGAEVINQTYDADQDLSQFEILLKKGVNTLSLAIGNRELRDQSVIVARSVLVDEVTQAYERLHATVSMAVLHGAATEFRFEIPDGFDVTNVDSPLTSRFEVSSEGDKRLLIVTLREPTRDTEVLNISAEKTAAGFTPDGLQAWSAPQMTPLDVVGRVAVVGVLLDGRLEVGQLNPAGLISIDNIVVASAIPESVFQVEPGAPKIRPVAAYYSPQGEYTLAAEFRRPPATMSVNTNVLMTLTDERLSVRGRFAVVPEQEKLFELWFSAPQDWHVSEVTLGEKNPLEFESFESGDDTGSRVRVTLPRGMTPGTQSDIRFRAVSTPESWHTQWDELNIDFPVFAVQDAASDLGAIALLAGDDLAATPANLVSLAPIDDNEKKTFGLEGVSTDQAYRIEADDWSAELNVRRNAPRITAEGYSFVRIRPDGIFTHCELLYSIAEARARELSFSLPMNSPSTLSVTGADGAVVKDYASEERDGRRFWTARLSEAVSGQVKLIVKFQDRLTEQEPKGLALAIPEATGVAYQTSTVAVEGHGELDIQVQPGTARPVDVGKLAIADYRVGRRLLGAYGFLGVPGAITVDVTQPDGYGLPPVIVERGELVTLVSAHGVAQTAARYHLRTKASYLEIVLPKEGTLWSIRVDGESAKPQQEGDSLLVSFPHADARVLRDLQIVFETPIDDTGAYGQFRTAAPRLFLRNDQGKTNGEVPVGDLTWHLELPSGFQMVQQQGTVFSGELHDNPLPIQTAWNMLKPVVPAVGGSFQAIAQTAMPAARMADDAIAVNSLEEQAEYDTEMPMPMENAFNDPAPTAEPAAPPMPAMPPGADDLFGAAEAPQTEDAPAGAGEEADDPFGDGAESETPADAFAELPMQGVEVPEAPAGGVSATTSPSRVAQAQPRRPIQMERLQQAEANLPEPQQPPQDRRAYWALEGVGSLQIDIQQAQSGQRVAFQSLGAAPVLDATIMDSRRSMFLGLALAIVVVVIGFILHRSSMRTRFCYVLTVCFLANLAPLVSSMDHELQTPCSMVCAGALLLIPFYFASSLLRWTGCKITNFVARRRQARSALVSSAAALVLIALMGSAVTAQQPDPVDINSLLPLILGGGPVDLPKNAVIVPYHGGDGEGNIKSAEKLLVPYETYAQLWNRAFPDNQLEKEPLPAKFALSGARYTGQLHGEQYLLLNGVITVDVFDDAPTTIPLGMHGVVFASATLDGQPARLRVIQPEPAQQVPQQKAQVRQNIAQSIVALSVEGKGRKKFAFSIRLPLEKAGGWRIAGGHVPTAPATQLTVSVPESGTELRLGGVLDQDEFETQEANENVSVAVAPSGELAIQWRPKIAQAEVDQSLTAQSSALLDVGEDGLRVSWQLNLSFPRSRRNVFLLDVPQDYLVEKVLGSNIRNWRATEEDGRRRVEVTLLKEAMDRESFTLVLAQRVHVGSQMTSARAPVVGVVDAALHTGMIQIRRSPLLDLVTSSTEGVTRTDISKSNIDAIIKVAGYEQSPLGIRPYQAYRFVSTPFTLELTAAPVAARRSTQLQNILRITERKVHLESRILMSVQDRPIHRVGVRLPEDLDVDFVSTASDHRWSITPGDGSDPRRLLTVYLSEGQQGDFAILLRGSLDRDNAESDVSLLALEVVDVDRQQGAVAIQIDPAFTATPANLQQCENALRDTVYRWLKQEQRAVTNLAITYRNPNYSGTIRVATRRPEVKAKTFTNVRITERSIEELVVVDLKVSQTGIRQFALLLPESMSDANVEMALLRTKTVSPVPERPGLVRFTLQLQDELMGDVRALIRRDRLVGTGQQSVPIPIVETGETSARFCTIENSGRDEVVIEPPTGLEPLGRLHSQRRVLASILGDAISDAFVVNESVAEPELAYRTKPRDEVKTAGARIGKAETILVMDPAGTYRAQVEFRLNNDTEQFLEVLMPQDARLWTASVAGEPVKPTVAANKGSDSVRIPLVKTAEGDTDYAVILKYGGHCELSGLSRKIQFPLVHTSNINVEISQVRLRLPRTHRWMGFGGTMQMADNEGDYRALDMKHFNEQYRLLSNALSSGNKFSRMRAANNLKRLEFEVEMHQITNDEFAYNKKYQSEVNLNRVTQQQASQQVAENERELNAAPIRSNSSQLQEYSNYGRNSRSRRVVSELGSAGNFEVEDSKPSATNNSFNQAWLYDNGLATNDVKGGKKASGKPEADGRVVLDALKNPEYNKKRISKGKQALALPQLYFEDQDKKIDKLRKLPAENRESVRRYREQLLRDNAQHYYRQNGGSVQNDMQMDGFANAGGAPPVNGPGQMITGGGAVGGGAGGFGGMEMAQGGQAGAQQSMAMGLTDAESAEDEAGFDPAEQIADVRAVIVDGTSNDLQVSTGAVAQETYLASLDTQLPLDAPATEYFFVASRGQTAIEARAVSASTIGRGVKLAVMLGLALLLIIVDRIARRIAKAIAARRADTASAAAQS